MKKLDYVDALRGLAILGIIMVHSAQYGSLHLPRVFENVIGEGARGVQLFFLVSAFTLFFSFKNRAGKELNPVKNFFIRRFFRIAPMYYLGIFYFLLQDHLAGNMQVSGFNIASNFFFLHGLSPYWIASLVHGGWSISVEMTFYLMLPFLFSRIKNIQQAFNFFLLSIVVNAILNYFLFKYPMLSSDLIWSEFLFLYFPNQLPVFALGILMYFLIAEEEFSFAGISAKSLFIFCALFLADLAMKESFFFPRHILFGVAFLILGISLSKYKPVFIINPVVNYIGKISFSMYLVHFAVLYWLKHFDWIEYFNHGILNYATRFTLVTLLTILIASVFYYLIEIPFQKIGKRLIIFFEIKAIKNSI